MNKWLFMAMGFKERTKEVNMWIKEVYGPKAVLINVNFSWEHIFNTIMETKRKFCCRIKFSFENSENEVHC